MACCCKPNLTPVSASKSTTRQPLLDVPTPRCLYHPAVLAAMRPLIEDVESRNKIRKASLVPLTIATSALVEMGRQASTSALLSALNKLPKVWRMQAESELNTENNEVDLVLEDELKESLEDCDEHAEMSFLHELVADFEPYAHIEADDEKCPSLHPISAQLAKQLKEYHSFRTANLNRLRTGTKVVDITFEHEKQVRARRVTRIRLLLAVFSLQSCLLYTSPSPRDS